MYILVYVNCVYILVYVNCVYILVYVNCVYMKSAFQRDAIKLFDENLVKMLGGRSDGMHICCNVC
jgi:hypothetical protein